MDQLDGLSRPQVQVDMWVLMTGKGAIQRLAHGGRNIAMQVESRRDRRFRAYQLPNRLNKVAFQIIDALDDASAVKV